jgi:hypothetical protein
LLRKIGTSPLRYRTRHQHRRSYSQRQQTFTELEPYLHSTYID